MERKQVEALKPKDPNKKEKKKPLSATAKLRAEVAAQKAHIDELEAARELTATSLTEVRVQYADLLQELEPEARELEIQELQTLLGSASQEAA
jgi:hypothetical protein